MSYSITHLNVKHYIQPVTQIKKFVNEKLLKLVF